MVLSKSRLKSNWECLRALQSLPRKSIELLLFGEAEWGDLSAFICAKLVDTQNICSSNLFTLCLTVTKSPNKIHPMWCWCEKSYMGVWILLEGIVHHLSSFSVILHQRSQTPLTRSDSGNSDDNYVPMNPGSSPLSAAQADSPKNVYIPMSPGPHHFDFPGFSATLPARKASSASLCHRPGRLSDVTPPPINRNLKPNRKRM